ncbi:MAG: amidohydrolase family protein [Terriglobales bacterium]
MRKLWVLAVVLVATSLAAQDGAAEFKNGRWWDGNGFRTRTAYVSGNRLTFHRPHKIGATIDLAGKYVVPPLADAHNHYLDRQSAFADESAAFLHSGTYYLINPDAIATLAAGIRDLVGRPDTPDALFANGGFTATGGHPQKLFEQFLWPSIYKAEGLTKEQLNENAYYLVDSPADFEREWPRFLATKPQVVKVFLLRSDRYAELKDDTKAFGTKGLDPALVPIIVDKAHAAGLRVIAHIENAADFHNALVAGVDIIGHTPYGLHNAPLEGFRIPDADLELAARRGTVVTTTMTLGTHEKRVAELKSLQKDLLQRMLRHHVRIAIGTDSLAGKTLDELQYIHDLGAIPDRGLLRLAFGTARIILPDRRVGELKEGSEASFLVLDADPLQNIAALRSITMRFKDGRELEVPLEPPAVR